MQFKLRWCGIWCCDISEIENPSVKIICVRLPSALFYQVNLGHMNLDNFQGELTVHLLPVRSPKQKSFRFQAGRGGEEKDSCSLKPSPGEMRHGAGQEHTSSDVTKVKTSSLIHMTFVLYAVQQVLFFTLAVLFCNSSIEK